MTWAAVPFVACAFIVGCALIVTGTRSREWANTMAGIFIVGCLTLALIVTY